jgi:hypothetical protein
MHKKTLTHKTKKRLKTQNVTFTFNLNDLIFFLDHSLVLCLNKLKGSFTIWRIEYQTV